MLRKWHPSILALYCRGRPTQQDRHFSRRRACPCAHGTNGGRNMPQIVVENLRKSFRIAARAPGLWGAFKGVVRRSYREVHALEGISFAIEPGELVGYIGPNGAGKSTTVKVLSGILVPDGGEVRVN